MRRRGSRSLWLGLVVVACRIASAANVIDAPRVTTSGVIALANLDDQIAQRHDEAGLGELLLLRSRFLGDYEALDRATGIAEGHASTADELLQRARARSAEHRFGDALTDLAVAEKAGADAEEIRALRASILIATGRANEVVAELEAGVARHPGFTSRSALAGAYAAVGRLADADRLYSLVLDDLDTTSPFPYAWICFARGLMWEERGGDAARGEELYAQALAYLPQFVAANIHLAELEIARGAIASSMSRLERVVASSGEPEALALLGKLHMRTGSPLRGRSEISRARQRYESLLARHPLAFADHAAEFYLGPGADAERAWVLAQQNLAARETDRALALAIGAAWAAGRHRELYALVERARSKSQDVEACSGAPSKHDAAVSPPVSRAVQQR